MYNSIGDVVDDIEVLQEFQKEGEASEEEVDERYKEAIAIIEDVEFKATLDKEEDELDLESVLAELEKDLDDEDQMDEMEDKDEEEMDESEDKEEDEKIKAKQAEKIESLTKEKHVSDMELAKAKSDLKNIRSGIFSKNQKKQVIKEVMGKVGYTPTQLDCFLRGDWKKVKNWSQEDVKFALSLRTMSRKAYRWIRKKKLIPLAGESTLRRYMKDFQVPPGKTHFLIFHPI